uniref:NADH dehydrogenase subunit 6 n=1 Tax=Acanthocardia tuberculata TaxID=385555 RepID=Q06SA8_ACATU|nr:NADH dehydrogenase subunit 6 [Acanthocardia tuberculata]ABF60130.1 NADH dehydrogenase subunit 6 [Acanthocardia tuberculata]
MSSFLFFECFFIMMIKSPVDHPVMLMGVLVILVAVLSGILCAEISAFYSFVLFMVVAGGMLVVFAYCMALAPNPSFNLNTNKLPWLMIIGLVVWSFNESFEIYSSFSNSVEVMPVYSFSWGLTSVFLCLLLFLVMVAVATICNFTEGALIKKL